MVLSLFLHGLLYLIMPMSSIPLSFFIKSDILSFRNVPIPEFGTSLKDQVFNPLSAKPFRKG